MPARERLLAILFWSVIAAAFIGPGTLVTASTAGSRFGLELLWALAFATVACIVFQEMAARLTLVTGEDLAQMLGTYRLRWLISIVPMSVILGCMAYEAGNIQGAAVGLNILFPRIKSFSFVLIGGAAGFLLAVSAFKRLVHILGSLVAIMGLAFLFLAVRIAPPLETFLGSIVLPSIPAGAEWLVLGLIGTTVVPYNLFLGSGISRDTSISMMRFGLFISITLGGLISIAILVTGTLMQGGEGLNDLVSVVQDQLGQASGLLVAFGLFAAGFTSAITAPLAAGIIARGFFRKDQKTARRISVAVVAFALLSGLLDFSPEVIILSAQALNGLVLPLIAGLLWIITNSPSIMKNQVTNTGFNLLAFLVINVLIVLGLRNILSGWYGLIGAPAQIQMTSLWFIAIPLSVILALLVWRIRAARR